MSDAVRYGGFEPSFNRTIYVMIKTGTEVDAIEAAKASLARTMVKRGIAQYEFVEVPKPGNRVKIFAASPLGGQPGWLVDGKFVQDLPA
jgi:hypothetical protein